MPQVNLSTVTATELRQLLDSSRRRGDAALSYKILQEMAVRRAGRAEGRAFMARRPAEPHLINVELSDPIEKDELPPMPGWRFPISEAPDPAVPSSEQEAAPAPAPRRSRRKVEPAQSEAPAEAAAVAAVDVASSPPPLEAGRPLSMCDAEPEPRQDEAADTQDLNLRLHPVELGSHRAPRQSRLRVVAGFALGILVGTAIGWWAGGVVRDRLSPLAAPPAAAIQTAALQPRSAPAAIPSAAGVAEPTPQAPSDPAVGPADSHAGPASPPNAQAPTRDPDSRAVDLPPPAPPAQKAEPQESAEAAPPAVERSAPAAAEGCAAEPSAADRVICGDPKLRRLQRELRQAYTEALDAHQDRALLRERQLAWRDARNNVSDPSRLMLLYEERIRKLNAATAEARQQQ